jgi:hypothetical protein
VTSSNGWRTLIRPDDQVQGINALHRNTNGSVTIWHETASGYRLTLVSPNGAIRQATGRTKQAARAGVR